MALASGLRQKEALTFYIRAGATPRCVCRELPKSPSVRRRGLSFASRPSARHAAFHNGVEIASETSLPSACNSHHHRRATKVGRDREGTDLVLSFVVPEVVANDSSFSRRPTPRSRLTQHLANHSTYHRGQISLICARSASGNELPLSLLPVFHS